MRVLAVAREQLDMDVAVLGEFAGDSEMFRWVDAGEGFELGRTCRFRWPTATASGCSTTGCPTSFTTHRTTSCVRDLDVTRELGIGAWVGVPVKLPDGRLYGAL